MTDDDDFEVTAAQRAYLLAFDNWLHTNWKAHARPVVNVATDLKDACLSEVFKEAGMRDVPRDPPLRDRMAYGITIREKLTQCLRCGGRLPKQIPGRGRPRKYCLRCRPSQVKVAA